MSQNIKNTLYRFVTMRAPELIGDEDRASGFVKFPVSETSDFLSVIDENASAEVNRLAVKQAVDDYELVNKSVDDLKQNYPELYDFAKWLTSNRTKLTVDEADNKLQNVTTSLSSVDLTSVWDDLHYLIFTKGSPYLRDLLLSFVVADFFKINQPKVEATDEAYQKLAQARVVIDKKLFQTDAVVTSTDSEEIRPQKGFEKVMQVALAKEKLAELESIKKEILKSKKRYNKANKSAKEAYERQYNKDTEAAYDAATLVERVVTDADTGETSVVEEYQNLNLPTYDFQPANELDITVLQTQLSDQAYNYVVGLQNEDDVETFTELENITGGFIDENTDMVSSNTDFTQEEILVGGQTIPLNTSASGLPHYSFYCCPHQITGTSLYKIIMTINMPFSNNDFAGADYDLTFSNGDVESQTSFDITNNGNLVTLVMFANGVDISSGSFTLEGEFFNNSIKTYKFLVENLTQKLCVTGRLVKNIELVETTPVETPTEETQIFGLQRLGIADYRRVEQEVCCYVPGEVSHIENIMAREFKQKDVTRRRTQEVTDTVSNEQERENLTETTSTDRFEMNQEMSSLSAQDQSSNVAAGINWNGKVGGYVNGSFANNTSSEQSQTQAINHSKELTERALDRVVQKVREERITKVVEEYEETSSHGFDNRKGDKHISGVYRWVDKVYRNQIHNYGKRLMYEFMVPEPAAFHNLAIKIEAEQEITEVLVKPIDPRDSNITFFGLTRPNQMSESDAMYWAGAYNAEIKAKPAQEIYLNHSFSGFDTTHTGKDGGRVQTVKGNGELEISEGYAAKDLKYAFVIYPNGFKGTPYAVMTIAGKKSVSANTKSGVSGTMDSLNVKDRLAYSYSAGESPIKSGSLSVRCELTAEGEKTWQIETFNAIIEAYKERLEEYYAKLASQKAKQEAAVKLNPGFYRQIEKSVLRKNCIAYMLGNENLGLDMLNGRENIENIVPKYNDPALQDYADKVKFFEQAFEWDIMSYHFYPMYWASKENWLKLYQIDNDDHLFRAFLQSGMARVIITVRPGFEEMVNWYLATGQIWNGGQVPTLDDEEFVSIVEELRNPVSVVDETWETRVPTSLTVIQAGAIGLDVQGLPCDTDCDDFALFDSDGQPILDEDGVQETNNPIVDNEELIGGNDGSDGVGSDAVSGTITVQ